MAFAKLSARDVDFDLDGFLNASGKLYTYEAGTTTPLASYSDAEGTENANPIIFDSSGQYHLWLLRGEAYKLVFTDADDVVLYTEDDLVIPEDATAFTIIQQVPFSYSAPQPPSASLNITAGFSFTEDTTFPVNLTGSFGHINTNPTASYVLTGRKNATTAANGTAVMTVTIATDGTYAFATVGGTSKAFADGDHLSFWGPDPADATANNFNFTLRGEVDQ